MTSYTQRPFTTYNQPPEEVEVKRFLLLTSDAGIDSGTIYAHQFLITDKRTDQLDPSLEVYQRVSRFLIQKGAQVREGILLTNGLHEALKTWGEGSEINLAEMIKLLETAKDVTLANAKKRTNRQSTK